MDPVSPEVTAGVIGAAATLSVAFLGALLAYLHYLRQRAHDQESMLNALFGELANLFEHYTYAANELPQDASNSTELGLRLRWSMYGELHSVTDVSRYGFLTASDIGLLLQLRLRVRNADLLLEHMLAEQSNVDSALLRSARMRMRYVTSTVDELLQRIVSGRPKLKLILVAVKKDLPTVAD